MEPPPTSGEELGKIDGGPGDPIPPKEESIDKSKVEKGPSCDDPSCDDDEEGDGRVSEDDDRNNELPEQKTQEFHTTTEEAEARITPNEEETSGDNDDKEEEDVHTAASATVETMSATSSSEEQEEDNDEVENTTKDDNNGEVVTSSSGGGDEEKEKKEVDIGDIISAPIPKPSENDATTDDNDEDGNSMSLSMRMDSIDQQEEQPPTTPLVSSSVIHIAQELTVVTRVASLESTIPLLAETNAGPTAKSEAPVTDVTQNDTAPTISTDTVPTISTGTSNADPLPESAIPPAETTNTKAERKTSRTDATQNDTAPTMSSGTLNTNPLSESAISPAEAAKATKNTEAKAETSIPTTSLHNTAPKILPRKSKMINNKNTTPSLQFNGNTNISGSEIRSTPIVFRSFNVNEGGAITNIASNSTPSATNTNTATILPSKSKSTSTTLAAIFGRPSIKSVSGFDYTNNKNVNNLAAQKDYTLVGDSPYETTYDPQSSFYYKRVYGQLYITTISAMFRGKAFGPIGAIPYERRLLLPFLEVFQIEAYKTTSVKITMNDGESYVFKSFRNQNAIVKLLRRTRKKCCESQHRLQQQRRIVTAGIVTTVEKTRVQSNTDNDFEKRRKNEVNGNDTVGEKKEQDSRQRSKSVPTSLRMSKSPQRTLIGFEDKSLSSEKKKNNPSRNKDTSTNILPETPVQVECLQLSVHGDDDVDAVDQRHNSNKNNSTQPRRLFDFEPNSTATKAPVASVLLSPPRMTISQRRQPKTPQAAIASDRTQNQNNSNANSARNSCRDMPSQQAHRRSGKQTSGGTLASIPSIPTVPSLNTPEPRSQRAIISIGEGRVTHGTTVPFPISEIDPSTLADAKARVGHRISAPPITPIHNQSPTMFTTPRSNVHKEEEEQQQRWDSEELAKTETAWQNALKAVGYPKLQKDWQVALEPTKLQNCNIDDWYDLFFSDDAIFSLVRYQLEHVGDRDVSVHPWRKKPSETDDKPHPSDGTELEREISYIHPLRGKIGPSEAETFRAQSLKRYGNHGAILKSKTTVGKGIPLGDCFHVEDMWIIERDDSPATNNDILPSVTLSVTFRVVFVKRTMFKGIIQKNTLSETKEWFKGYSEVLQNALESPQHQELKFQRRALLPISIVPEEIASSTPSSSSVAPSLMTTRETSIRTESSILKVSDNEIILMNTNATGHSPYSSGSVTAISEGHSSRGSSSKAKRGNTIIKNEQQHLRSRTYLSLDRRSSSIGVVIATVTACVVVGLLIAVMALWLQVRSIGTSLSLVEGRLGELQTQNTVLLQKLEELSMMNAEPVASITAAQDDNTGLGDGGGGNDTTTTVDLGTEYYNIV